jgi:D-3-phosphoglycerate dehydrogenase / 2-oxoglutarate reductase
MAQLVIPDDEPPVILPSAAFTRLSHWDVRTYNTRPATPEELLERIRDARYVINVRSTSRFTREVLQGSSNLKLISIWGTGTDNVDLSAASDLGIRVTNTPGVSAIAVAEHALTLMLSVARRIVEVDGQVREGKWPRAMVTQLHGKTVGLIGTGAIGREMVRLAKGIGCRVIAWSFHPQGDFAEWVELDDVFRQADVVSVHVRQSPESTGMIRREHFELMKPGAILINTARGPIVNEADLVWALQTRRIAGAGLDVFDREPLPVDNPLLKLRNVVLTPHSAGITPETTEAGIVLAIDNIFRFAEGNPRNVVV